MPWPLLPHTPHGSNRSDRRSPLRDGHAESQCGASFTEPLDNRGVNGIIAIQRFRHVFEIRIRESDESLDLFREHAAYAAMWHQHVPRGPLLICAREKHRPPIARVGVVD